MADIPRERTVDAIVDDLCRSAGGASDLEKSFALAYVRRIPHDYLQVVSHEALCGQLRSLVGFVGRRPGRDVLVRVFNPSEQEHGYVRPGAVLEFVAPDVSFLVDSVTNAITAAGYSVEVVVHPVVGTTRNRNGELTEVKPARSAAVRESVQHYELDRRLSAEKAAALETAVRQVLGDVRRAADDFEPMQGAVYRMIKTAREGLARYEADEIEEAVDFLEWLLDDNFVFLGYREYEVVETDEGPAVQAVPFSGLGILSDTDDSQFRRPVPLSAMSTGLRRRYEEGPLLVVTKTNSVSRVHRRARMDYIGVRHIDEHNQVSGETRLIGLFTSKAYMQRSESTPVLRRKLARILEEEDAIGGSHHYKQVVQLFNSIPQDELFSTSTEEIRESILGLIEVQEREQVRLFIRSDLLQRAVSVLVVLSRDRFNADVRKALQALILERLGGTSIDYRLALGEGETARIHFTVWMGDEEVPRVDVESLEAEVIDIARTWEERLTGALSEAVGADRAAELARTWAGQFPDGYKSSVSLESAVDDVIHLDRLTEQRRLVVGLRPETVDGEEMTSIAVYRADGRLELSTVIPTLEHFGLRVIEEVPTRLRNGADGIHIHDFGVLRTDGHPLDVHECGPRVAETLIAVLEGRSESDSLSRLIINAGLDHPDVSILRAYRTYWQRVGSDFTPRYINDALAAHPEISAQLISLFEARFHPEHADEQAANDMVEAIRVALDRVASLDEDRILRGFLDLMLATKRTNAYLPARESTGRIAFKFASAEVPGMPAPTPLFEIFVYAPEVEGIHVRGGLIARGGIRWSVRREDYRTEVLGLMKAQMTKNAVIVPRGAKGGFVLRRADPNPAPDVVQAAYTTFIRGLLDLTDNLVDGEVVHPEGVVVHDQPDPYMVVAADKGTATYSDTANEVAAEYGFWLGDAFASGGSAGYDHKALGITARGAWESVRWHLRDVGIDPDTAVFTVVGIGDMSGDVFGNAMLLARGLKLIAAFDHRHVFIDPQPDPATAYDERSRLFEMPESSWDAYDRAAISPGGGVWPRSAKWIELSAEARAALGTNLAGGTPDEVIHAILAAPVDLLWNGGVGTFVKATDESHLDVGDRNNDGIRIDAADLRCQAVGEGGNLGFTQRGREEYARAGGRIFTDFIDNSGGVNCSDREVNLKILLALAVNRGELDNAARDELVQAVAPDVVSAILYDNFLQAQILNQEAAMSAGRLESYEDLMSGLEAEGLLDRSIEYLPDADELRERAQNGQGMLRPELSVLLTYAKRSLTRHLVASNLPDDPDFTDELNAYFPAQVVERFGNLIAEHPLRRELIATLVANRVTNSEGITFISRLAGETGMVAEDVVRAYRVARTVTAAPTRWHAVEALVGTIDPDVQRELLTGIDSLVEEVTRWQLTHVDNRTVAERVAAFGPGFAELAGGIHRVGPESWKESRQQDVDRLLAAGVPEDVALRHAYQADLVHGCDIIGVATDVGQPVLDVAHVFLQAGTAMQIDWLEEQLDAMPVRTHWQRQALRVIRDDLGALRRRFADHILEDAGDLPPMAAVDHFLAERMAALGQLARFFRGLSSAGTHEVASLLVAMRRIEHLMRPNGPP